MQITHTFQNFQASTHILWPYRPVCVKTGWKCKRQLFSRGGSNNGDHLYSHLTCSTFQVVKQSNDDQVTVIGCCVTLVEALRAYEKLAIDGVNIRVVDPFTLKPLDKETIMAAAKATGGRVITVEDHYEAGEYSSLFQVGILQQLILLL